MSEPTALEMLRALQKTVKTCHRECDCADNLQLAIAKLKAEQARTIAEAQQKIIDMFPCRESNCKNVNPSYSIICSGCSAREYILRRLAGAGEKR